MPSFFDYPGEPEDAGDDLVLLPRWGNDEWQTFASYCEVRRYAPGDVVIDVGDIERAIYIATTGRFEVVVPYGRSGRARTVEFGAGSVIGEISFFDGKPRTARVRALVAGEMLRLSIEAFDVLAANDHTIGREILLDLGRLLAVKLRTAEAVLAS